MPDIVLSQTQLLALGFLERCVRDLEPLAALTGAAGAGKTIVLNTLLAQPDGVSSRIIRVNNFVAGPLSLHRVLASTLGVVDAADLTAEALEPELRRALADAGRSEPPVLAVDDAQSLLPETLRYLCLLAGLREAGRPLLRILLVGRPGFTIRQSMPQQFTLEAVAADDARRLVLHGFEAAGLTASDETVQDIVRSGQGNLRKLDFLIGARIEHVRAESRKRKPPMRAQTTAAAQQDMRPTRRSSTLPWLVVPALLVVGAGALAVAYHDGMFGDHDQRPATAAVAVPVPVHRSAAAPLPVVPAAQGVLPRLAAAPSGGPGAPAAVPPSPVTVPATTPSQASVPAPVAARAPAPASVPAATTPPAVAAPVASPVAGQAVTPPATTPAESRFRIYNISACHQGVCPRWSVTDLDQRQHFVASFNPTPLHLDRDTLQRLREGSLDLVVSGSVARNGADGWRFNADVLQAVATHHGRLRSSSTALAPASSSTPTPPLPAPQPSEPVELAPSQLQSPQPGFLPVPPPQQ